VFSGAIKKIKNSEGKEVKPKDGEIASVYSNKDEFLGKGYYQDGSIAVRVLTFSEEEIDKLFWTKRIEQAYSLRRTLDLVDNEQTNCFRLIHAEGDGCSGLILDYYNGTVVFQAHSIGIYLVKEDIVEALKDVIGKQLIAVFDKSSETLPKDFAADISDDYLFQEKEPELVAKEHGASFKIDWLLGQKTGFFIDQRDNRLLLSKYSKNKKVLNTFCYTGGFSILALQAGAELVDSVDASKRAIELTNENVALNGFEKNHRSFAMDTFKFFESEHFEDYDVIILDPPAFAKHHNVKHNAVQGYKRLNSTAMKNIKEGGILFTFSCSQVIDQKLFYNTVMSAAIQADRNVRVLHQLTQPADHPINIFHPESSYLKGLVLQID
jgi:23S rRNA (cytosine1962-C5)-methyltransferase